MSRRDSRTCEYDEGQGNEYCDGAHRSDFCWAHVFTSLSEYYVTCEHSKGDAYGSYEHCEEDYVPVVSEK